MATLEKSAAGGVVSLAIVAEHSGAELVHPGSVDIEAADLALIIGDVSGLQSAIDAKATASHTHAQSDVTGLVADLAGKQAALVSGTSIKTLEGASLLGSGNIDLAKGDVGLGNVDNTTDLGKPISTATQAALDAKVPLLSLPVVCKNVTQSQTIPTGCAVLMYDGCTINSGVSLVFEGTAEAIFLRNTQIK